MKKIINNFSLIALLSLLVFSFSSCDKDDDPKGDNEALTVNGVKWRAVTIPSYNETQFYVLAGDDDYGHMMIFYESLEDVEKGEDVTPEYVLFSTENAEYEYISGEVTVTKTNYPKSVTVKFDDYTIEYAGKYLSGGGDARWPDIQNSNSLVINGSLTFFSDL